MKTQKPCLIAAIVCLLALFASGFAYAQPPLPDIIQDFCREVLLDSNDAQDELDEANRDARDCAGEFNDCQSGLFNNNAATCVEKYLDCGDDALRDANQSCSTFSRQFGDAYEDALRQARRQGAGVERRFQTWIENNSDVCLLPAVNVAVRCTGVDN
jgi:hypothetical protein